MKLECFISNPCCFQLKYIHPAEQTPCQAKLQERMKENIWMIHSSVLPVTREYEYSIVVLKDGPQSNMMCVCIFVVCVSVCVWLLEILIL